MEEWILAVKNKVSTGRMDVPPDDWKWFEDNYFVKKRKKRVLPLIVALVSATAAAAALLFYLSKPNEKIDVSFPESSFTASGPDDEPFYEQKSEETKVRPRQVVNIHKSSAPVLKTAAITASESVDFESFRQDPDTTDTTSNHARNRFVEKGVKNSGWKNDVEKISPFRKRVSLSTSASGFLGESSHQLSSTQTIGGISGTIDPGFEIMRARHLVPVSFEVNVSADLTSRLALTTGMDMTIYRSIFSGEKTRSSVHQRAYYLGIPLRLDWAVWDQGRFSLWLGGGGKVDYLVYGKLGDHRLEDRTWHGSVMGNVGAQYNLTPTVGLFLKPEISYYFRPSNPVVQTYRTDHPLYFTLGVGLKFRIP